MNTEIFRLFSNCTIVAGYSRSVICDLQRRNTHFIPNSLASLFVDGTSLDYNSLATSLDPEDARILKEYIDFLVGNELGFFASRQASLSFPALSMEWDYPARITNCILDANDRMLYLDEGLISQLDRLGCYHIQLRFFSSPSLLHIRQLITLINLSEIRSIELILAEGTDTAYSEKLLALSPGHKKIRAVLVHSASEDKVLQTTQHNYGLVVKVRAPVMSAAHCGIVNTGYFQTNIAHFTESLHHNTCLNRKISIDTEGNIKSCPSMRESFGNIKDTTLEEALNMPGFKKHWNITKDLITKCKDCEFRHVCTDCRAYLENPEDSYSAPLKCGYDPYTCTWEEWSTHPMKQRAIDHYGIRNISKTQ